MGLVDYTIGHPLRFFDEKDWTAILHFRVWDDGRVCGYDANPGNWLPAWNIVEFSPLGRSHSEWIASLCCDNPDTLPPNPRVRYSPSSEIQTRNHCVNHYDLSSGLLLVLYRWNPQPVTRLSRWCLENTRKKN